MEAHQTGRRRQVDDDAGRALSPRTNAKIRKYIHLKQL
jgi:hypothetical protein